MKKAWFTVVLAGLMAQGVLGDETLGLSESHPHEHKIVSQNQYYVAYCSRNDLYQRFTNLADARRAAAEHARATGHSTGVVKE